ncbi:hypothetical protein O6H91_21G037900 [Diphasiastrum complanatum]|uniref:Uncharacterized protein n=1 Tax=Diphasiastrum complanatum TaxID=34168 RepID=A0ACC2AJU3_DIPCM|nr:hypothetical protein O6H91_21G037900 [Diphasiastrum complanatum]
MSFAAQPTWVSFHYSSFLQIRKWSGTRPGIFHAENLSNVAGCQTTRMHKRGHNNRVGRKWKIEALSFERCGGSEEDDCDEKLAILHSIERACVVACLRTNSAKLALEAARAALDGGITMLEVTMTTPGATEVIKALVHEYPLAIIGAGTVLTMREAYEARSAGARFLMSPVTTKEIVQAHNDCPVLFVPGAMTLTEVVNAYKFGAALVKLYPVTLVGGLQFVKALKGLLRHIPVIASHGIRADMVESYLAEGAAGVVLSDAIFDRAAIESNDFQKIKERASAIALI